jgi:hypothetical protein
MASEVSIAIGRMKLNNAAGSRGAVAEMVKAAGEVGTRWTVDVCNAAKDGNVLEDWSKSR